MFLEDPLKKPFTVSLFCGESKSALNKFLSDWIHQRNVSAERKIFFSNCHFNITIRFLTSDAPAWAYIKCTKPHNYYYGCDLCIQKCRWKIRLSFSDATSQLCTNESFCAKEHWCHHKGESLLLQLDANMINAFPLDYMHLVCLGVMCKLLLIWCGKAKICIGKVSAFDKEYLNSSVRRAVVIPHQSSTVSKGL